MTNQPLIPDEMWDYDDLTFNEGTGEVDQAVVENLPDDIRDILDKYGYLELI